MGSEALVVPSLVAKALVLKVTGEPDEKVNALCSPKNQLLVPFWEFSTFANLRVIKVSNIIFFMGNILDEYISSFGPY